VIDLARYLVGDVESVSGTTRTFKEGRDVDDAFEAAVRFENGAVGTLEASRFCPGRKNSFTWEINGSKGSIAFDLERLNELQVHLRDSNPGERAQGFRTVLVSEADHPFWEHWWPHGHIIGWEHSFVHEIHHLLSAIAADGEVTPHGATFEDGYRTSEICDAIVRSSDSGKKETVTYR
jgi:predicted dehydrogenase